MNREVFMINLNNKITENFFQASNKILTDNRLSSNAKLVYCYLASKPTGWKVINAEIQKSLGIGYDCLNSCWKQLLQTGWISREQKKNENNLFAGGYDYTLYISPQENTLNAQIRENPVTGETPEHINTEKTSNTEIKSTNVDLLNIAKNTKKQSFTKPTIEEIKSYAREINLCIDCEYFFDYYESNGWKVSNTPMKDWKATLRNWARREQKYNSNRNKTNGTIKGKYADFVGETFEV